MSLGAEDLSACDLQMRFLVSDPLVVRVSATGTDPRHRGPHCGVWVVSRDLLRAGLSGPTGIAMVHVEPVHLPDRPLQVAIEIRGQGEDVKLLLDHRALRAYVERTHMLVPFGTEAERAAIDREIEQLLDEDG